MKVFRWVLVCTVVVALAGCSSAPATPGARVSFEDVAAGNTPGAIGAESATASVATTRAEVIEVLGSTFPWMDKYPSNADAVIVVFGGTRPNGGFGVTVREVRRDDATLRVSARLLKPPAGVATTDALANPYVVVAVPSGDIAGVTNVTVRLEE